ncbi:MAG: hypothetical protein AB7F86_04935 [Bdellovibrionales bacterium]
MKKEKVAMSGQCLLQQIRSSRSADEILSQNQITTKDARPEERAALASGLAQIETLYGERPLWVRNVDFRFAERVGYSSYQGMSKGRHRISMNRCNSKGSSCASNNVAHLMHELAHKIGHSSYQSGETFYQAYERLAGRCQPTRYSRRNSHEEFAEVFAAFITHPEILSQGNSGCQRAYAFFAQDVFYRNGVQANCNGAGRTMVASRQPKLPKSKTQVWFLGPARDRWRESQEDEQVFDREPLRPTMAGFWR